MNQTKINGNLETKIIGSVYEFSSPGVNLKIENHKKYYCSKDGNLNSAEIIAIKHEQLRIQEEIEKKKLLEERDKKIKENLKNYNNIKKQKQNEENKKLEDKETQKEKLEKFNKELRNKTINKKKNQENTHNTDISNQYNINNNYAENHIINDNYISESDMKSNYFLNNTKIPMNNKSINEQLSQNKNMKSLGNISSSRKKESREFETFSFNDIEREIEKPPQPAEKMNFKLINRHLKPNESVVDIRDDIDLIIKKKLDLVKNNINNGVNIFNNENSTENNIPEEKNNSNLKGQNINSRNINNINTTFNSSKICDISSISNRKNANKSSVKEIGLNIKNNNILKSVKNYNSVMNKINDSSLSEFSNQISKNNYTKNLKSNKSSSRNLLKNHSKNNFSINTNFMSEKESNLILSQNQRALSTNNKVSLKNSNFFNISTNKKSVNNLKNNITSKYYEINTQETEYNENNTYCNQENTFNNDSNIYSNKKKDLNNTSCISDFNVKNILERNIDTVKNFRKTGLSNIPYQNNEKNVINITKNFKVNTSYTSNSNQVSIRKFDKSVNDSSMISNKKSKSNTKINENLQKRR